MNVPNVCFIPLVTGPYLHDLATVMQKIDSLGQDLQKIPYAVFLLGDLPSTGQAATHRHHMSPAVVSTQFKHSYVYNFTQITVGVKKDKSPNTIFHFQCQGNSSNSHKLLLTADGRVNRPMKEVCAEKREVRIAYNQYPGIFEVDNVTNTMVEYSLSDKSSHDWAYEWEILSSFLQTYNLSPVFYWCNDTWGWFDEDTGLWNGAVAMVNIQFVCI